MAAGRRIPSKEEYNQLIRTRFPELQHQHGERYYEHEALRAISYGIDLSKQLGLTRTDGEALYKSFLESENIDPLKCPTYKSIHNDAKGTMKLTKVGTTVYFDGKKLPPAQKMYGIVDKAVKSLPNNPTKEAVKAVVFGEWAFRNDIFELFFPRPTNNNHDAMVVHDQRQRRQRARLGRSAPWRCAVQPPQFLALLLL